MGIPYLFVSAGSGGGYDEEYNKIGERFFINYLTDSI